MGWWIKMFRASLMGLEPCVLYLFLNDIYLRESASGMGGGDKQTLC